MEGEWKEPVNLEILSVGPLFRELDYRRLEGETRRPPFYKQGPLIHTSMS